MSLGFLDQQQELWNYQSLGLLQGGAAALPSMQRKQNPEDPQEGGNGGDRGTLQTPEGWQLLRMGMGGSAGAQAVPSGPAESVLAAKLFACPETGSDAERRNWHHSTSKIPM